MTQPHEWLLAVAGRRCARCHTTGAVLVSPVTFMRCCYTCQQVTDGVLQNEVRLDCFTNASVVVVTNVPGRGHFPMFWEATAAARDGTMIGVDGYGSPDLCFLDDHVLVRFKCAVLAE